MLPQNHYGLTKRELIQFLAAAPDDAVVEISVSESDLAKTQINGDGVYFLTLPGDGSVGADGICLMASGSRPVAQLPTE